MLENLSSALPVPCLDNKDRPLGGEDRFHICWGVQTLTDLDRAWKCCRLNCVAVKIHALNSSSPTLHNMSAFKYMAFKEVREEKRKS